MQRRRVGCGFGGEWGGAQREGSARRMGQCYRPLLCAPPLPFCARPAIAALAYLPSTSVGWHLALFYPLPLVGWQLAMLQPTRLAPTLRISFEMPAAASACMPTHLPAQAAIAVREGKREAGRDGGPCAHLIASRFNRFNRFKSWVGLPTWQGAWSCPRRRREPRCASSQRECRGRYSLSQVKPPVHWRERRTPARGPPAP